MPRSRCLWGAALASVCASWAAAGPWALWEGESVTALNLSVTRYSDLVLHDGTTRPAAGLRFATASLSVDYGLTDAVTVSLELPYVSARGDNRAVAPRIAALGDAWLGARRQFLHEGDHGIALAVGAALKLPGSDYRRDVLSAPGDGQVDWEARVLAGRTIGSEDHPAYWDAEVGYRWRVGSPGDELLAYLECGCELTDRLQGRVFLDHVDQRSGYGLGQPGWTFGDFPAVEEDLDLLGVGATYSLREDLLLDARYARHVHVENSARGWHLGVSLVTHRLPF